LKKNDLFVPLWNKLYKKKIIDKYSIRNKIGLNINEDLIFNQEFFKQVSKFYVLPDSYYYYKVFSSENSLSKQAQDPIKFLEAAKHIKESDFSNSGNEELSNFDKIYYWNFLRNAFVNSFSIKE